MKGPLVSLQNISAGYEGKVIVRSVSLDVYDDDFIALIGPNGGGKSTLAKIIMGLYIRL